MITEAEARALYRQMLARVGEVLARDIEVSVLQGAVRGGANVRRGDLFGEEVNSEFSDLIQVSNRDALVIAIRTLLSALDPIFQLFEVQRVLHAPSEGEDVEERQVTWDFDRAALRHVEDVLENDPARLVSIEPFPQLLAEELSRTRQRVEKLARLVREFEDEVETGADQ